MECFSQECKKSNAHVDYLEFDDITNTFIDNFKKEEKQIIQKRYKQTVTCDGRNLCFFWLFLLWNKKYDHHLVLKMGDKVVEV